MIAQSIRELISEFEEKHLIKQIILIGNDGAVKNIELELVEED